MDATAELPQTYRRATEYDKRIVRKEFIEGKGSGPKLAQKHNLSVNTVHNWIAEGKWQQLKEHREATELAKLQKGLLPHEPEPDSTPSAESVLLGHLKRIDDLLQCTDEPRDIAQLARARTDLEQQLYLVKHGCKPPQGKLGAKPRKTPLTEILPIPSPEPPVSQSVNDPNEPNG